MTPLPALIFGWSVVAVAAAGAGVERFAAGTFLVEVVGLVLLDHRPYSVALALPLHLSLLVGAFWGNSPVTAAIIGGIGILSGGAAMAHQYAQNRP